MRKKPTKENILWKRMYDKTQLMWHKGKTQLDGNNVCQLGKQWKVENEQNIFNNGNSTQNSLNPMNKKRISVTHFYHVFEFYVVVLEQYPWWWPRKPQHVKLNNTCICNWWLCSWLVSLFKRKRCHKSSRPMEHQNVKACKK